MAIDPSNKPRWADPARADLQPLTVHEALFEAPDGRRLRLVAASREALVATGAQLDAMAGQLRPAEPEESQSTHDLDEAISYGIAALHDLVWGHDAFDVMILLRQFVMPPDLALWRESETSPLDSWAAVEVVGLVLLGLGLPTRAATCAVDTASIVADLAATGATIVQLATMRGLVRTSWRVDGSSQTRMSELAWRLASHEISVRGRQYPQIAAEVNARVLRTPKTDAAFGDVLGFTYDDVLAVREALITVGGDRLDGVLQQLHQAYLAGGPPSEATRAAAHLLFRTPAELQLATAKEVAQAAGLDVRVAQAVLDTFSARPDGRSSEELVRQFCEGRNPLAGKAILHAPGRGYLPLPGAIAEDEIRRTCEARLKTTSSWTRYGRARDQAVENLVSATIDTILRSRAVIRQNVRYRHRDADHDLSSTSTTHQHAPVAEADALVLLDGVALCVEVKAGDFRLKSRQGGVQQLHGDVMKTIGEAAEQATRLRSIIENYRGLWLEDGTWLDLSNVHETHSIVACLDDLGPLALATSELVQAGVLTQTQLPWVVGVHDLLVFQRVLDRPEHLLTYLRRRTNRDAAMWITGTDELDILMWFVAGGFYFEPDPDRIFARHANSKPPTTKKRREYANQGRTLVGTFTDQLDAHMYFDDGLSSRQVDCPRREPMHAQLAKIFDAMAAVGAPGWWRAASDIDSYSAQAQASTAGGVALTLAAGADGSFHTFATGGADDTGRWIYIFAAGADTPANREHLRQYLEAKKHQEHADRALGVLLAPDGRPRVTLWLDDPWAFDPDLDALARAMRLVPPDRAPSTLPPRARKRQPSKRGNRGKRRR
ncbi:hypothetical protein [Cellulomonas biazotea]|uniref:NERD domain-containing protein n=1 Tax=Cellulomonas biazotea TaxID=1709 RepID=A0A402DNH3_9CELL|nr:hypothetical protein [Cellulomonas biazotea]GCE75658.1 hypothetical protein CBZ_07140 [Cellulomonas biazotea]